MGERTFSLAGVRLVEVPEGTVLQQGADRLTVTDDTAVFVERSCYVTPTNFARISAEIERAGKACEP